jgi:hypothetical protein
VDIVTGAPVITRDELHVHALPAVIWSIQTDIAAWPNGSPRSKPPSWTATWRCSISVGFASLGPCHRSDRSRRGECNAA